MAYERQVFIDQVKDADGNVTVEGTTLRAEHLNHIESGIVANEKAIASSNTDLLNKILDPDNYPLTDEVVESTSTTITLEIGKLDRASGAERDGDGGLRTPGFVPVVAGGTIYFHYDEATFGRVCLMFFDSENVFIPDWNEGIGYRYLSSDAPITCPDNAASFRAYFSTELTEGTLEFSDSAEDEPVNYAEHKKIYIADHGYTIYGDIIDDDTMHKIVIRASGKDNNAYNITEIKAPSDNPQEATIALMNWGNGVKQFVDFSSMVYDPDNPTVEIVCQSRGGMPLPEFSVRYNDGAGSGRVKKFVITPDCIPIKLTSEGIQVRRNNNYDNNATESELVTVNLAELHDTVEALSSGQGAVKTYIAEEARRVSDIVHENRTADSFVFAALADCHYGQNDGTLISIQHTAKAICEIDKNVSLDAVALLGDFVRGDGTDTSEGCNDMLIEIRKEFYEATRDIPSIWTVGNHDNAHYYTKDDVSDRTDGDAMYSYLGSNNRDTVVDASNRQRIYGYRDFETQKIRAIYCNTADVFENTSTSSAGVSDEQLAWLTSTALNFSDKSDAKEWGVIFFSHHPLEWSSRSTEKIITVINSYINGTDDFADVTDRAEIIAAIHGHTHNFRTNSISDGKIPSIGIPQVCYARYNEYATDEEKKDEFGEFLADGVTPVYYKKAMGSAQETSFNVIVVDRKTKKIFCTCYGAGRDREYAFTGDIPAFAPTFVTATVENGGISLSSGENVDSDTSFIRTADFIECNERDTYMFVTNDLYWALMFYDENQAFLDTGWDEGDSYKYLADTSYRVPVGAKYMRLFCEDTSDATTVLTIHNIS